MPRDTNTATTTGSSTRRCGPTSFLYFISIMFWLGWCLENGVLAKSSPTFKIPFRERGGGELDISHPCKCNGEIDSVAGKFTSYYHLHLLDARPSYCFCCCSLPSINTFRFDSHPRPFSTNMDMVSRRLALFLITYLSHECHVMIYHF